MGVLATNKLAVLVPPTPMLVVSAVAALALAANALARLRAKDPVAPEFELRLTIDC